MPNIDLIIKLISTQDVRKWDNATLLLWATEMAKLVELKEQTGKDDVGIDRLLFVKDGVEFYCRTIE